MNSILKIATVIILFTMSIGSLWAQNSSIARDLRALQYDAVKVAVLQAQLGVRAELPDDFEFDAKFKVLGYEVTLDQKNKELISMLNAGARYSKEVKTQIIDNLKPGDIIYFDNIKVIGPDNFIRNLGTLGYRII